MNQVCGFHVEDGLLRGSKSLSPHANFINISNFFFAVHNVFESHTHKFFFTCLEVCSKVEGRSKQRICPTAKGFCTQHGLEELGRGKKVGEVGGRRLVCPGRIPTYCPFRPFVCSALVAAREASLDATFSQLWLDNFHPSTSIGQIYLMMGWFYSFAKSSSLISYQKQALKMLWLCFQWSTLCLAFHLRHEFNEG